MEGGFDQSSSWVSLFEIARKLEVRNWKFSVHYGAFIIVAIEYVKDDCILSPVWVGQIEGGFEQSSSWVLKSL